MQTETIMKVFKEKIEDDPFNECDDITSAVMSWIKIKEDNGFEVFSQYSSMAPIAGSYPMMTVTVWMRRTS